MKSFQKYSRFRSGKQFKNPPPGLRRELAALVFDCLIDRVNPEQAELRIKAASPDPAEVEKALGRYRLAAGCTRLGVTL